MYNKPLHKFHIPVMGLAFTIDSPVKVAPFGISSVISIVESRLIEMMRKHYYQQVGEEYIPINLYEDDSIARRVTDYLNLVNKIVQQKFEKIKEAAFEAGSDIVKYFEMLPDDSVLKKLYQQMVQTENPPQKHSLQESLRLLMHPGSIDVNIMTKTDRNNFDRSGELIKDGSDAVAALRGYANSGLKNSSVIFSAGTNLRLYNYLEGLPAFDVNTDGGFTKKVVIKVSDYRSAIIQGKYLAKKGIWVSEFRVESGLNCGGHAFATEGLLLGPILEEFKTNRQELIDTLFELYNKALLQKSKIKFIYPPPLVITVQGGIGTFEEAEMLYRKYNIESTGWGTPFLLVPEATTVDEETLKLLSEAKQENIVLSKNSPLGISFYYLKGTTADKEKHDRIARGNPGSPCTEKHLAFNTEFTTEPICTASRRYQKLKIAQLQSMNLSEQVYNKQLQDVLDKECLCIGLSNSAAINYSESMVKNLRAVTICPGPNIINFSEIVSLQKMVDHIYGRKNIIANLAREHFFITELKLYINYLKEQKEDQRVNPASTKTEKYFSAFYNNLKSGILYYRELYNAVGGNKINFLEGLNVADTELDKLYT